MARKIPSLWVCRERSHRGRPHVPLALFVPRVRYKCLSLLVAASALFPYQNCLRLLPASSSGLVLKLTTLSQFLLVVLHKGVEVLSPIKARTSVYLEHTAHPQFVRRSRTRRAIVLRAENGFNP